MARARLHMNGVTTVTGAADADRADAADGHGDRGGVAADGGGDDVDVRDHLADAAG